MKGSFLILILKIVFIIIGTFVGAGFASGKEIYLFFYKYGLYGILGIFISSVIIGFVMYKVIYLSKKNNIDNYDDFLNFVVINKKIKLILENIINIFLIMSFCVMISGFCGFIRQEFNINSLFSYLFIISLCIFIFINDIGLIMKISNILIPIIIVTIVGFFVASFINYDNSIFLHYKSEDGSCNFFISCILYASYNLLSIVPINIAISRNIKKNKIIKYICIISCMAIITLSFSVFMLLNIGDFGICQLDMPITAIVGRYGIAYKYYYCIIIGLAIITTALSVGYAYLQKFKNNEKQYFFHIIVLILCTTISAQFGFSELVEILYPVFGVIGIIQNYYIIKK